MDGFSRVDDMLTHENYRSRGYGRTIVHSLAAYHSGISQNQIYLYASNPVAIRMYQAVGFTKIDYYFKSWSAWQNK
jgi:predicted GNAT family acetyltransferase